MNNDDKKPFMFKWTVPLKEDIGMSHKYFIQLYAKRGLTVA